MEFAEHTLTDSISFVEDITYYSIIKQMLTGLQFIHGHSMIHGDLKPANILVNERYVNYLLSHGVNYK